MPRDKSKRKYDPKSLGCNKSNSKRKVHRNTILPQKTRKISNEQPNLISKAARGRTNKIKS